MKWIFYGLIGLALTYVALFALVLSAMLQPPERFGLFMKHMPEAIIWGGLPAPRMWLWVRSGTLERGHGVRREGLLMRVCFRLFGAEAGAAARCASAACA